MSRLYDWVSQRWQLPHVPVVVVADNVREYAETLQLEPDYWKTCQLNPPFRASWIEFRTPRHPLFADVGFHIVRYSGEQAYERYVADTSSFVRAISKGKGDWRKVLAHVPDEDEVCWTIDIAVFQYNRLGKVRQFAEPLATWMVPLDEHGRRLPVGLTSIRFHDLVRAYQENVYPKIGGDDFTDLLYRLFNIAAFAITFMHTKNVELIDHEPPAKLSKKHEKRYGQPLVTYKTIKVNPMRTVTRLSEDAPSRERKPGEPIDQALHIVRGNFADYRDGPGLFGKPSLKGLYWREQHIRGKADKGIIVKDYDVQAPTE